MNIDRKMVSLFFEIKRNMPYEQREDMKIAASDLGAKLIGIYQESQSESLNTLIEQFMERAGPEWAAKLSNSARSLIGFGRQDTALIGAKKNALKEKESRQKLKQKQARSSAR